MESSFELKCCVSASSLATAPPLVFSCHRVPSNSTAVHVDLCYLACRFVLQPKILLHSGSLIRFHSRLHLAVVSPRLLQSRHRHLALVILRPRLPLLSPKHLTLALHIP